MVGHQRNVFTGEEQQWKGGGKGQGEGGRERPKDKGGFVSLAKTGRTDERGCLPPEGHCHRPRLSAPDYETDRQSRGEELLLSVSECDRGESANQGV